MREILTSVLNDSQIYSYSKIFLYTIEKQVINNQTNLDL